MAKKQGKNVKKNAGPDTILLQSIRRAVEQNLKGPFARSKLMVVGEGRSGKLVNRNNCQQKYHFCLQEKHQLFRR